MPIPSGTAVITGASSGIGALYAEGLAERGHDLVIVARRADRLQELAARLEAAYGVGVEVVAADLSKPEDVRKLESRLAADLSISILVNNAGMGAYERFGVSDIDGVEKMIAVNITALTRLTRAVLPQFVKKNAGAIVNIGSVLALRPWEEMGPYAASKSYVLAFSQALQKELEATNVLVQVVNPPATATDFWSDAGASLDGLPPEAVMTAEDLVKAGLLALERHEPVSFPSLPDAHAWENLNSQRAQLFQAMMSGSLAPRYVI